MILSRRQIISYVEGAQFFYPRMDSEMMRKMFSRLPKTLRVVVNFSLIGTHNYGNHLQNY